MGQVREFFERLNLLAAAKQVKQNGKTLLRLSNDKMMKDLGLDQDSVIRVRKVLESLGNERVIAGGAAGGQRSGGGASSGGKGGGGDSHIMRHTTEDESAMHAPPPTQKSEFPRTFLEVESERNKLHKTPCFGKQAPIESDESFQPKTSWVTACFGKDRLSEVAGSQSARGGADGAAGCEILTEESGPTLKDFDTPSDSQFKLTGTRQNMTLTEEYIQEQIGLRRVARKRRDFREADEIRDALLVCGVQLKDKGNRTIFKRV